MLGRFLFFTLVFVFALTSPAVAQERSSKRNSDCPKTSWNPKENSDGLAKFYALGKQISQYLNKGYADADTQRSTEEYLRLAEQFKCNWNYGNATHDGNSLLGMMALGSGDVSAAKSYLAAAGRSTGSPQLDTFGPDLILANALLKTGAAVEVSAYLRDVQAFWEMDNGVVNHWLAEISQGVRPELSRFTALRYQVEATKEEWRNTSRKSQSHRGDPLPAEGR